jgi:opacity protein-like surface antigen
MRSVRDFVLAGAAVLLSYTAAGAADLPPIQPMPAPPMEFHGWYLRGDIGMTNQRLKGLDNALFTPSAGVVWLDKGGFDSSPLFGIGIGYQWNNWLRFDVTGEYRGKASFTALDRAVNGLSPTGFQTNEYTATKSEWVGLANVYIDLGTWWHVTPFVGAGVGFARNTIENFRDVAQQVGGVAYADSATKWNFAWAAHAGLAYKVNPAFTVELAYRYIDLGDAVSGDLVTYLGQNTVNNPMQFNHITSHDLKLGVRWHFDSEPIYAPPPLVRKG